MPSGADRAAPLPPAWQTDGVDDERACWGHQANARNGRRFLSSVRFDQLCNDAPMHTLFCRMRPVEVSRSKGLSNENQVPGPRAARDDGKCRQCTPLRAARCDGAVAADTDGASDLRVAAARSRRSFIGRDSLEAASTLSPSPADTAPPGNMSETAAKAAIEADGYKAVRALARGSDGVWKASALRGQTEVLLSVSPTGGVSAN
jgi:hypothetical protein